MAAILGYTTTTTTAFAPVRASLYFEQSSNAQRSLSSSSANDTAAGTGARTVRVTYFDASMYGPFTEDVTLNGTTPVNMVNTDVCFIQKIEVLTVGALLGNSGTITLHVSTGGAGGAVGQILPGDNQTQWCHYYVAPGRRAKIISMGVSVRGRYGGSAHLRSATPTLANTPEYTIAPVLFVNPGVQAARQFSEEIVVYGPARLTLYALPFNAASTDWQADLEVRDT